MSLSSHRAFLSGIAYRVGASVPIDNLSSREDLEPQLLASLKARGLRNFCEESASTTEMCLSSAVQTLGAASLSADRVDAVVFASSNADWNAAEERELLCGLNSCGFERTLLVGLSLQACSGCSAALQTAAQLLRARPRVANVLVILCGRRKSQTRIAPYGTTVFSDGAATCLVSSEQGQFEVLANASLTNAYVATLERSRQNVARHLEIALQDLQAIADTVYAASALAPSEVKALFGTNGSLVYLHLMAQAARLPQSKVYSADVERFGHVHSCDSLISLKNFIDGGRATGGENYLLMGWSPYIVSASVLRSAG